MCHSLYTTSRPIAELLRRESTCVPDEGLTVARLPPVAAGPDRARRIPVALRRLCDGAVGRRSGAALHADGHPGEGRQRIPPAAGLQRSAPRAIRALRGWRPAG